MEAASRSPAGNGKDQCRGQWEGAHHTPRANLHVSQGTGGAHHTPRGNLHVSQGSGGAHHAPRGNLNVSKRRGGAQNVPRGRSGFQGRRGTQGRGRAQNALTRDTPWREGRGRVGRGRSGRRSAGRGDTLAQTLLGTPHTIYRLREMGSSSLALYRLVRSETKDQGC